MEFAKSDSHRMSRQGHVSSPQERSHTTCLQHLLERYNRNMEGTGLLQGHPEERNLKSIRDETSAVGNRESILMLALAFDRHIGRSINSFS